MNECYKESRLIFDWNCGCWPKLSNPYLGQHQILHLPDPSGHLFSWLVLIRMTGELERNLSWLGGLQRQSQSCQRWSCHEKETAMPIVYVENTVRDKETGALFQKDFHFFSSAPFFLYVWCDICSCRWLFVKPFIAEKFTSKCQNFLGTFF